MHKMEFKVRLCEKAFLFSFVLFLRNLFTVGGPEFTVGGAVFTVGGAEFTVGGAVFTVGETCLQ